MEPKYQNLFSPVRIRNVLLRNRIIGAPLGAWVFSQDNYIFDYALKAFEDIAKGGAATVCVGHTEVNAGEEDSDGFGLYFKIRGNNGTAAMTEFAHAIRQHGCQPSIELNYGGVYTHGHRGVCYGPDGFVAHDGKVVHEMTREKIQQVIGMYAECVEKMRACGFTMVTIHGAHGWLPHQFFLAATNHRTDEYGGSLENRMRFPIELCLAVREAAGDDMVVEYRVSGIDPQTDPEGFEELVALCNALEGIVDIIHVSSGGEDRSTNDGTPKPNHMFPSYLDEPGINLPAAAPLKARIKTPVAVVGQIYDAAFADEVIASGQADFVAMCRPLMADPELPNKSRRGQEEDVRTCIGCYKCLDVMHHTHMIGCDINPRFGREARVPEQVPPAPVKKKVAVVGGGPAGMQAAITASQRGHEVTLYEMSGELGGLLKITNGNYIKRRLHNYEKYLITQLGKSDVRVLLNTEATPELMNREQPDVIFVASGSRTRIPDIEGVNGENVFTTEQAHENPDRLGERVVIIGGNLNGCESALFFKHIGKKSVTIAGRNSVLHRDKPRDQTLDYYLYKYGVDILTGAPCRRISPEGVYVEKDGQELFLPCDSVVLASGREPRFEVFEALRLCAPDVVPLGDCITPATVRESSRSAYFSALDI